MPTALPIPNQQRPHHIPIAPSPADNTNISPSQRWVGSPMSYKLIGSLGSRFYPSTSPGPFTGPLDLNDFNGGIPSSIESDHGRIFRAIHMGDEALLKDELIQDYACCGLELHDLHALLEHFEEAHVVVLDSPQLRPTPQSDAHNDAFDPDAMELDEDDSAPSSSASSPPSTPPLDSASSASAFDTSILRASFSSACTPGAAATATSRGRLSSIATNVSAYSSPAHSRQHSPHPDFRHGENAFMNNFTSFSQFSTLVPESAGSSLANGNGPNSKCIPPALLFSTQTTPNSTPTGSRISSPVPGSTGSLSKPSRKLNTSASALSRSNSLVSPSTPSTPTCSSPQSPSSQQTASKPFKCPTVGCNKSYKQANGLKYHTTHGQCNFMPPQPGLEGLDEKEADIKSRPYVCQVGNCTRRYKNMNGLRYHYQHSGTHGAVGLALLASGQHALQTGSKEVHLDDSGNVTIPASILNTAAVNAANAATAAAKVAGGGAGTSAPSTPQSVTGMSPGMPSNTVSSATTTTLANTLKNTHIKSGNTTPVTSRAATPLGSATSSPRSHSHHGHPLPSTSISSSRSPVSSQLATNTSFSSSPSSTSSTPNSTLLSKSPTPISTHPTTNSTSITASSPSSLTMTSPCPAPAMGSVPPAKLGQSPQTNHYLPKQQTPPQLYVQGQPQYVTNVGSVPPGWSASSVSMYGQRIGGLATTTSN
ncbi:uncharacterized protein EI90DRAFT_3043544 [Cantharellus anzutake]|uniref:uncharacterized protein n=1 Tax=Cantharellus anzutake TaxID=1750568 RepID=UPI001903B0D3|nr:uncharacterized protein EI90DRAFT_3043544 [Cantharellus anzutake]KAF8337606.1 hypothetical protein EI90DRAFT_3043544 [Cantharellus anzutake]